MPDGMCKILVVMRPGQMVDKLCKLLQLLGYTVTAVCHSGGSALRGAYIHNYDIILCSDNLPDMTGLSMLLELLGRQDVSAILITNERDKSNIESRYSEYDITCLVKPVSRMVLQHALEITWKYRMRINNVKQERDRLQKTLNNRTIVAKAKAVLMENSGMSEEEAYRALQKTSMDTGIPVKKIAATVIESKGHSFYKY